MARTPSGEELLDGRGQEFEARNRQAAGSPGNPLEAIAALRQSVLRAPTGTPAYDCDVRSTYASLFVDSRGFNLVPSVVQWASVIDITVDLGPQDQSYGYIRDAAVSTEFAALFPADFGTTAGAFGGSISPTSDSNGREVLAMIVRDNNLVLIGLDGSSSSPVTVPKTLTITTTGGTQTLNLADAADMGVGADGNLYVYWNTLAPVIGVDFTGPQSVQLTGEY